MNFNRLNFKNIQLSNKLIITYILLTVIPMAFLGYIAYSQYSKSIEAQVGEYITQLLGQANNNIENEIKKLESLPDLIYSSGDVMKVLRASDNQSKTVLLEGKATVQNYLSNIYLTPNNTDILGAFLLSKNRLFSSTRSPYENFGFKDGSFPFQSELIEVGNMKLLLPDQTKLTFEHNPSYVLLVKQITDFDNRNNLGTLYLAVNVSFFERILKDLQQRENTTMWLMDQHGKVFFHTDQSQIGKTIVEINDYPLFNGSFRTTVDGEKRLISVSEADSFPWILGYSIPLKNLTEETDGVRNGTILIFILLACISTLISILLAWS